jgi:hypothetical protein
MERQDIDDELARAGAQELLTSTSMARLACIGKDGTPRVIPIGFFRTGDQVVHLPAHHQVCLRHGHLAVGGQERRSSASANAPTSSPPNDRLAGSAPSS